MDISHTILFKHFLRRNGRKNRDSEGFELYFYSELGWANPSKLNRFGGTIGQIGGVDVFCLS